MINISKIAEYVYTVLLRPRIIRLLADFIICKLIPKTVRYGGAVVALNPKDPVVSGALTFRVYEKQETAFVISHLKQGGVFLDIGANIGYYTAIAMGLVGEKGTIISCEPDVESYKYLKNTVSLNKHGDVVILQKAVADIEGKSTLFISKNNRGDNRLYSFDEAIDSLEVDVVTVDLLLERTQIELSKRQLFVKIDVQGGEGRVIQGMRKTIANAIDLVVLMEFWPQGLNNVNTMPKKLLFELESLGLNLFELGATRGELIKIEDKDLLIRKYSGRRYTNIVGLKTAGA